VQDSTLSARTLGERVLKRYRLPGQMGCRFYRKGICDTYTVEAGAREYYLKVYRSSRRTRTDVTEEVRLLNHLADNGISVARPVARRDGMYVSQLTAPEGTRYSVLFEAAGGTADDDEEDLTRTKAFGHMVGRMHASSDRMPGDYRRAHLDMRHLLDDNLSVIASLVAHRAKDLNLIRGIAEECRARVTGLLPQSKPEYGICHGDLHGGDVHYDANNRPTLFDFDSSGYGWRALDIGVFLASDAWMDTSAEAEERRQRGTAAFVEGYSRTRKLTEQEMSVVQLTPPIRHIFLMGHVLRYTAVHQGDHWANDQFIDWHMAWFRHWAAAAGLESHAATEGDPT